MDRRGKMWLAAALVVALAGISAVVAVRYLQWSRLRACERAVAAGSVVRTEKWPHPADLPELVPYAAIQWQAVYPADACARPPEPSAPTYQGIVRLKVDESYLLRERHDDWETIAVDKAPMSPQLKALLPPNVGWRRSDEYDALGRARIYHDPERALVYFWI